MFNFWPFNIARKRREAVEEFHRLTNEINEAERARKRNKVTPPENPAFMTGRGAKPPRGVPTPAPRPMASRNFGAPYGTSTPADDIASNLLHPLNPLNTLGIYHSSPAPESRCDSPSDSSSYDSGSSSCSAD